MVHVLLKPGLENFEHHITNVWDECNCAVSYLLLKKWQNEIFREMLCRLKILQILNILQAKLQQYMNHELPDVQAGFRKAEKQ